MPMIWKVPCSNPIRCLGAQPCYVAPSGLWVKQIKNPVINIGWVGLSLSWGSQISQKNFMHPSYLLSSMFIPIYTLHASYPRKKLLLWKRKLVFTAYLGILQSFRCHMCKKKTTKIWQASRKSETKFRNDIRMLLTWLFWHQTNLT